MGSMTMMTLGADDNFPTILWCWVLALKRQRPASSPPLLLSSPSSSSSPSSLLLSTASSTSSSPSSSSSPTPISAHPSHVSWPHRELHRRPQWQGPHAVPLPFRGTPRTFRGPIRCSTGGPSGRARMHFHIFPHPFRCTPYTFRIREATMQRKGIGNISGQTTSNNCPPQGGSE